jgi:sterol desaturase/sphingolipid hydroxylase (fatty acid hydroxylase superfamily)
MDPLSSVSAFEEFFKPAITAFSAFATLCEILLILYLRKPWNIKSRAMSIACFLIASNAGNFFYIAVAYHLHHYLYQFRLFDLGFSWYVWILCFILIDTMFYVTHRMHHRIRLLWCVHSVHHSAEQFELTTGIRGSFLDTATQFPVYAWLPLIGIHPLMYVVADTIFKFLIFIYHTEFIGRLGVLERIFVTPSSHRVHHGKDIKYLDRNYGGVFIFLDRWLGTHKEEEERPTYGVRNKPANYNIIKTQADEFVTLWRDVVAAPTPKDKLMYLFQPPGWRHDGPGETSEELQRLEPTTRP